MAGRTRRQTLTVTVNVPPWVTDQEAAEIVRRLAERQPGVVPGSARVTVIDKDSNGKPLPEDD